MHKRYFYLIPLDCCKSFTKCLANSINKRANANVAMKRKTAWNKKKIVQKYSQKAKDRETETNTVELRYKLNDFGNNKPM